MRSYEDCKQNASMDAGFWLIHGLTLTFLFSLAFKTVSDRPRGWSATLIHNASSAIMYVALLAYALLLLVWVVATVATLVAPESQE